jgi:hypothetical protein
MSPAAKFALWITCGVVLILSVFVIIGAVGKPSASPERSYSKPEVEMLKEGARMEERNKIAIEQQYGR